MARHRSVVARGASHCMTLSASLRRSLQAGGARGTNQNSGTSHDLAPLHWTCDSRYAAFTANIGRPARVRRADAVVPVPSACSARICLHLHC